MRRIASFVSVLSVCSLLSVLPVTAQTTSPVPSQAVAVEPAVVAPGQSVTLRWLFTGDKVVVIGGRFGQGLVVTGRTTLKDNPKQTTTYRFDVWYKVPSTEPDGKKTEKTVHAQYSALVQVARPLKIALKLYRDPYGWQVAHLLGWKHDKESLPDPSNNALVFFQPEDDSVERLAVAILPVQEQAAEQLVEKVEKSLYDNYDDVKLGDKAELQHVGIPAVMTTFTGMDHTHPGTRTETVFLAFVKNGRGYVISARTKASLFAIRRPALEKMVRSFALVEKTAQK